MPKSKSTKSTPKQVTISKFFAPKQGLTKHPVGVKVVTDDDDQDGPLDQALVAGPSGKKRKENGQASPRKAKKKCLSSSPGESISAANSRPSTSTSADSSSLEKTTARASLRLQAFQFVENADGADVTEKKLWKPKDLPDISSQSDNTGDADVAVLSDNDDSDGDESTSKNNSKGRGTSKKKDKAEGAPNASKKSTDFLNKFTVGTGSGKKSQAKYTPLEQQYVAIKEQYPDAVLLVECGYKYRFFGQDAEIASEVLKIFCHPDHNFMTASIPVHRLFVHVRRLVAAGHKVGVVKQTETAALKAAGDNRNAPFSRKLSALYTKSTLIGEDVDPLSGSSDGEADASVVCSNVRPHHYLMCVYDFPSEASSKKQEIGILAVDPGTGDMVYDCFSDGDSRHELETRLTHIEPVEVLLSSNPTERTRFLIYGLAALSVRDDDRMRIEHLPEEKLSYAQAFEAVSDFFSSDKDSEKLQQLLALPKPVLCCFAGLISYLRDFNLHSILQLISNLHEFSTKSKLLELPAACVRNLEIFQNGTDGSERGSLYWLLNHTVTRAGARLLRSWLAQPLRDVGAITARQDAVQELLGGSCTGLQKLRDLLARSPDLEKGLCSIYHGKSSALEFVLVSEALEKFRQELSKLQGTELPQLTSALLRQVLLDIPDLLEDVGHFSSAVSKQAARENDKANLFADEKRFADVAKVKEDIRQVELDLKDYRKEIRLVLRQPSLDYVTVSQTEYLVEVKNTLLKTVPKEWTQISSTKAVSRFHPPVVAEKYRRLSQLREQLVATVIQAWEQFLGEFSEGFLRYRKAVQLLASLDVLMSLAEVAKQDGYCRPEVTEDSVAIEIEDGRHPVIDALKGEHEQYVPNSTHLSSSGQRVMIVTGPNMGGKSSYIRQVALIAVMAQIGSFIPAASARLGVLDAIFTRMGAEDEIFRGRSTFMVELQEAGEIMSKATERSLVIIDELGRGTSTHDGVAIAYATLDYFITKVKSLTLFVTHYPMLAEFQQLYPDLVGNFHMSFFLYDGHEKDEADAAAAHNGDEKEEEMLTFLYQLTEGAAAKSYGLNVARLAHIPQEILRTATIKSHQLEKEITKRRTDRQNFAKVYQASNDNIKDSASLLTDID